MKKNKFFNIKALISFMVSIIIISVAGIVIASPDLEKEIKNDLSVYINHLNNGKISDYYDIYNTRKLSDVEKLSFYDRIKNSTKVVNSELEIFKKFKLIIKIKQVDILRRLNDNTYLCNVDVDFRIRESIDSTETLKKSESYILKIIYLGSKDGYKILLPFNSLDKDFSQSNFFGYIENIYKENRAKEVEEQRLLEEAKKEELEKNSNKVEKEDNSNLDNEDESDTNTSEDEDTSSESLNSDSDETSNSVTDEEQDVTENNTNNSNDNVEDVVENNADNETNN